QPVLASTILPNPHPVGESVAGPYPTYADALRAAYQFKARGYWVRIVKYREQDYVYYKLPPNRLPPAQLRPDVARRGVQGERNMMKFVVSALLGTAVALGAVQGASLPTASAAQAGWQLYNAYPARAKAEYRAAQLRALGYMARVEQKGAL